MSDRVESYSIEYKSAQILGRGGESVVFQGTFGGKDVAVKRRELIRVTQREIEFEDKLKKLNHPNVLTLLWAENHKDDFRCYAFELCTGSLDRLFLSDNDPKKYRGPVPAKMFILQQIASGVDYIHQCQLVHRDIKPANVLICCNDGTYSTVSFKLSDFGLSRGTNERGTYTMSEVKGTCNWMAPELMGNENGRGTNKSDVFSTGCVFGYVLLDGQHPFKDCRQYYKTEANIANAYPINLLKLPTDHPARVLYDIFLKDMMLEDPAKRLCARQVVQQIKECMAVQQKCARENFARNHTSQHSASFPNGGYAVRLSLTAKRVEDTHQEYWSTDQEITVSLTYKVPKVNKRKFVAEKQPETKRGSRWLTV